MEVIMRTNLSLAHITLVLCMYFTNIYAVNLKVNKMFMKLIWYYDLLMVFNNANMYFITIIA